MAGKSSRPERPIRAYVGTITARGKSRGDGIHVYEVDRKSGAWTQIQHLGGIANPTFFITNRAQTRLYSAHAVLDHASAYAIDRKSGHLSPLGQAATGGNNGVSLALDPSERFLVVVNYIGGNVAVLPLKADGSLGDPVQLVALAAEPRASRRVERQESSHPHDVHFDPSGQFVLIPDLGLDRVWIFRFDAGRLVPGPQPFAPTRGGAGPRHLAFHSNGRLLYVVTELDSTVTTYRWDAAKGSLALLDIISTLPPDFHDDSTAAEVRYHRPSRTLYATNRGHDSVVAMRVNRAGLPRPFAWQSSHGSWPRFFALDPTGRFLAIANQEGHNVVPFTINAKTGALRQEGASVEVGSPVTIAYTTR